MRLRRSVREWLLGGAALLAAIALLNVCSRPSPEDVQAKLGRDWARENSHLGLDQCPRDRGNPFWIACAEEFDRLTGTR